MNSKYRYLVPNGITFISLTCGIVSILLSTSNVLRWAGGLILASYILDLFDGYAARKLNAGSEFGLQLDSLVDMVSLGAAPTAIVFAHMSNENVNPYLLWPSVVFFSLAGAFRLARFNLLPPKATGNTDSAGLTISTGGAMLALAVLSDLVTPEQFFPDVTMVLVVVVTSLLMISTIPFPSFFWVFSNRRKNLLLISLFGISIWLTPFFNAWFWWTNAYLGISLARAGYRNWK